MRLIWPLLKRTFREFSEDNCSQLAAAISYYVLFAIIPLAIFLTSVFGLLVQDSDIQDEVIDRLVEAIPLEEGEGQDLVTDTVRGVSRVSGALTVVGLIGMAWSASAMFGAIRKALNVAWDTEVHRPLVQQKLIDLAMVLGLGLLLGTSIAGTAALRTLRELSDEALGPLSTGTGFFWSALPLALPGLLTFLVFLLIYRFVPNVSDSLREVWPGALLAGALFE
ncbi:MAG TPA: YihY/virulence factor BrkB family protein, partial [Mycobacterium sp.]